MTARPRGFSLVEIMISVVIFSAVILSLAGLSFQVAKKSTRATDQAMIMSVMLAKVDRAITIAYDSLDNIPPCDTTISGTTKIIGCTTVTSLTSRTSNIVIDVRTTIAVGHPDTVTFVRGRTMLAIPLR